MRKKDLHECYGDSFGPVLVVVAHPDPQFVVKTYTEPKNHPLVQKERKIQKKTRTHVLNDARRVVWAHFGRHRPP
jgi:hypothetical protein